MAFDLLKVEKAQIQSHVGVRLLSRQLQIGNLGLVMYVHVSALATFRA
jgi:hypothetical protein